VVPSADLKTRTFPVKIRLKNPLRQTPATAAASRDPAKVIYKPGERPDHLLKPGMMVRATLRVGAPSKAVLVPKDAIVVSGVQRQIAVYTPVPSPDKQAAAMGKIEMISVETGASEGSAMEVLGMALKPGQLVVAQGNERLRTGMVVSAVRTIATETLVSPKAP
jgi:multidrug efflux pump subunit AcrA (membrane-fusion protein)